jgi:hypothetical protein
LFRKESGDEEIGNKDTTWEKAWKLLGTWLTPPEVQQLMVNRRDQLKLDYIFHVGRRRGIYSVTSSLLKLYIIKC